MALTGRKRQPRELRELAGAQASRLPPETPPSMKPPGALRGTAVPKWMSTEQRACWEEALQNSPAALLRRLDTKLLAVWVVAVCLHQEAVEKLNAAKSLLQPGNIKVQSTYLGILNRQAEIIMRATSELGFSPTSRARIASPPGAGENKNRFAGHAKQS